MHSFGGSSASFTDASSPYAGLVNVKGMLYGTTSAGGAYGGAYGSGTVYSIGRFGVETVLHSFGSGFDGASPASGLVNVKGTLYGTTFLGGALNGGTLYSISTSGVETVLHSFGSGSDGANPFASVVNVNGTPYGTTSAGGAYGGGTVYSLRHSTSVLTESVLHSFGSGSDGSRPIAGLVNVKGTLYGTTQTGGGSGCGSGDGCGTVYSIDSRTGTENVLQSFSSGSDGAYPLAGLLYVNGRLYGTTLIGGGHGLGTIYSISTAGTETVLYNFAGGPNDGADPYTGTLVNLNGTFYGTTLQGGAHNNGGAVYSLRVTTSVLHEAMLHSFGSGSDGTSPYAGLVNVRGTLYGTTYAGGASNGAGTVFALTP